jgi:iron complex outermembrane receptor protein
LELGARHPLGEVVLYDQRVQGPIVERVDSFGASSFANDSSSMRMQGVEARTAHVIGNHRLQASATWQHHRWASGKLPGSPQWMANLQWSWAFWNKAHRFESHLWIRGVGKTFLDNANENVAPGYALGNFEVTWSPSASSVKATMGMRNLTNTAYSGWNQLNAFGGRYYNPAPPRTGYVTLVWELN